MNNPFRCFGSILCLIALVSISSVVVAQTTRVVVIPIIADSGGNTVTLVRNAATTTELTLRQIGGFEVVAPVVNEVADVEGFRIRLAPGTVDRIVTVAVSRVNQQYEVAAEVISPYDGTVLNARSRSTRFVMDMFATIDSVILELLGDLAGKRIELGSITITSRWEFGFTQEQQRLFLDWGVGIPDVIGPQTNRLPRHAVFADSNEFESEGRTINNVLAGRRALRIEQFFDNESTVVLDKDVDIVGNETTAVDVVWRFLSPSETQRVASRLLHLASVYDAHMSSSDALDLGALREASDDLERELTDLIALERASMALSALEELQWAFGAATIDMELDALRHTIQRSWENASLSWYRDLNRVRERTAAHRRRSDVEEAVLLPSPEDIDLIGEAIHQAHALSSLSLLTRREWPRFVRSYANMGATADSSGNGFLTELGWYKHDQARIEAAIGDYDADSGEDNRLSRTLIRAAPVIVGVGIVTSLYQSIDDPDQGFTLLSPGGVGVALGVGSFATGAVLTRRAYGSPVRRIKAAFEDRLALRNALQESGSPVTLPTPGFDRDSAQPATTTPADKTLTRTFPSTTIDLGFHQFASPVLEDAEANYEWNAPVIRGASIGVTFHSYGWLPVAHSIGVGFSEGNRDWIEVAISDEYDSAALDLADHRVEYTPHASGKIILGNPWRSVGVVWQALYSGTYTNQFVGLQIRNLRVSYVRADLAAGSEDPPLWAIESSFPLHRMDRARDPIASIRDPRKPVGTRPMEYRIGFGLSTGRAIGSSRVIQDQILSHYGLSPADMASGRIPEISYSPQTNSGMTTFAISTPLSSRWNGAIEVSGVGVFTDSRPDLFGLFKGGEPTYSSDFAPGLSFLLERRFWSFLSVGAATGITAYSDYAFRGEDVEEIGIAAYRLMPYVSVRWPRPQNTTVELTYRHGVEFWDPRSDLRDLITVPTRQVGVSLVTESNGEIRDRIATRQRRVQRELTQRSVVPYVEAFSALKRFPTPTGQARIERQINGRRYTFDAESLWDYYIGYALGVELWWLRPHGFAISVGTTGGGDSGFEYSSFPGQNSSGGPDYLAMEIIHPLHFSVSYLYEITRSINVGVELEYANTTLSTSEAPDPDEVASLIEGSNRVSGRLVVSLIPVNTRFGQIRLFVRGGVSRIDFKELGQFRQESFRFGASYAYGLRI